MAKSYPSKEVELSEAEIEAAFARSAVLFDGLLDDFKDSPEDPGAVAYGLWIDIACFLADYGWTVEDLTRDLPQHIRNRNNDA